MTNEISRKFVSLTYYPEKEILDYLAAKIYRFFTADALTIIGFLGTVLAGLSFIFADRNINFLLIAPIGIVINWFGDSLDGRVARLRQQYRPKMGYYIDKFFDLLSYISIFLCLEFSPLTFMHFLLYNLILVLFFLANVFLKGGVTKTIELSVGIFGPTELRIIFIFLIILLYLFKNPLFFNKTQGFYTLLDLTGAIFCLFVAIILAISIYSTFWGKDKIVEE